MRARRLWFGLLGTLALAGLPALAGSQPVGSELQVNTYTTSFQVYPFVASDASGNFVVVWYSGGQDGSEQGIFGQRYDSAGEALGAEFRVNSYTSSTQRFPDVAYDASGNFVVVWESYGQDGSNDGVFGQRYDSAGGALGTEFRVNSFTTNYQQRPSVASDASGNFVVVWEGQGPGEGFGVLGRRYDATGEALGTEFRVNSYTTGYQGDSSVASDASGNFVIVWSSNFMYVGQFGVFGQRYDSDGVARGGEFRVTSSKAFGASVVSDVSGNFVVVWNTTVGGYGGYADVYGQRYDSAGMPQGMQFQVNSHTTDDQACPSVALDASGNFLVVWDSDDNQDGSDQGIFGQRYDSEGVALGDEFQINSFTTGYQLSPSLAATGNNQFVVAWSSEDQDGDTGGVFGQRFDFGGDSVTS